MQDKQVNPTTLSSSEGKNKALVILKINTSSTNSSWMNG